MCSALSAGSASDKHRHEIGDRHQQRDHDEDAAVAAGARRSGRVDHASTALPLSANMPRGRFWMNRMISTSTTILPSTAPA